jgi:hypothetical protein
MAAVLWAGAWSLGAAAAAGQDAAAPPKQPAAAQAAPEKPARKKPRGRLPAYYSRVVSQDQRTEIYTIQAKFAEQIEALRQQILQLEQQRDRQVRDTLSPEQQQQVDQLVAAAKARRRGAAADPPAQPPATPGAGDDG